MLNWYVEHERHLWLLLALALMSLVAARFYFYLTEGPDAPFDVPPETDRYIEQMNATRHKAAIDAANETLQAVRNG